MKSRKWWPGAIAIVLLATQACCPPTEDQVSLLPPECEKNWDWASDDQVVSLVAWRAVDERVGTSFLSGPGATQNTAEFHDCQRFVMGHQLSQPDTFSGGIFNIFAVPKSIPIRAHVAAPVYAQAADAGLSLPAAQIVARAPYDSLGIAPGFSCLYLYRRGGGSWAAHLRSDGWEEEECGEPVAISDLGSTGNWKELRVHPSQSEGPDATAYPVVARWIWHYDRQGDFQEYRMGVWCDLGWCEVGSSNMAAATPSFAQGVPSNVTDTKQFRVNGWFDEQILAGFNGSLYVSDIVGTIIPAVDLGSQTLASFPEGRWVPTAKVALTPLHAGQTPQNPFDAKLNLGLTVHGADLNQIYLCRGPWLGATGCQENGLSEPPGLNRWQIHTDMVSPWWAKIEKAGPPPASVRYFSTARCPYEFEVAGTARWRWLFDDPGIWMRCINGCCELRGGY